jgi:TonB family protein
MTYLSQDSFLSLSNKNSTDDPISTISKSVPVNRRTKISVLPFFAYLLSLGIHTLFLLTETHPLRSKATAQDFDQKPPQKISIIKQKPTRPPKKTEVLGMVHHTAQKDKTAPQKKTRGSKSSPSKKPSLSMASSPSKKAQAPISYQGLLGHMDREMEGAYEDALSSAEVGDGEIVDLNTKEYKFISYFSKIKEDIELAWSYPSLAVRQGLQGQVLVSFVIHKNGETGPVQVRRTSGSSLLDQAILNAIKNAAPFPPFPQHMTNNYLEIMGTFHYILR